jgi:hypothetical protein
MFVYRIAMILGISIATLLISITLDVLLAPLPGHIQFLVQIPALVIAMDELRQWAQAHAADLQVTMDEINGAFFFAAPLAAFGATSLFAEIRRTLL